MPISINELKTGLTILIDGQVYSVMDYEHVKPGKGAAFVRTTLRNLKTKAVIEKTFKGEEKIEEAFVEERKLEYLYNCGKIYYFMDQNNFEQIEIPEEVLGENSKFLKENLQITAYFYEGQILNIALPNFVELKVTHTLPGVKGDTAKAAYKSATVETGATLQVPLFIQEGDVIRIDTRSGEYVGRV